MARGLTGQVFNNPLDMLIEWRIHRQLPVLHPAQFLSLVATNQEIARLSADPKIRQLTPPTIYEANCALNYGYGLFTDWLTDGRTHFAEQFRQSFSDDALKKGKAVFTMWQEMMGVTGPVGERVDNEAVRYSPGDEYGFVDRVAELLGVSDWYEWHFQGEEGDAPASPKTSSQVSPLEPTPEGTTNPELLRSKDMATVMYLVAALERFEDMSQSEIQALTFEIAMVGRDGLDYSDPDRRYHLRCLPDEEFSGLQLLALMYAGFKRVAPDQDLGLDFAEPYALAEQLYQSKRGESE